MRYIVLLAALAIPCASAAQAQTDFTPELRAKLETALQTTFAATKAPSAVVALAKDGRVVYTGAFGDARLEPEVKATADMPYGIGSVSKQFTAAAVMLLAERGQLKLDDPVSTWFPELAHSHEITLRQLLNQVSGYSDYYTEDYLTPGLEPATTPMAVVKEWTSKPLDFAPGSKWQYSNTNYLLAGLIVQKVSAKPFFQFLTENILQPAGLQGVVNLDGNSVPPVPVGYAHFAFGPARKVPREGKGTLSGAGQLAMPIGELAKWDTVVMQQKLLKPSSWQTIESEYILPNGKGSGYGMGFFLHTKGGRRVIDHSGGLNGFVTFNEIFPASGVSISVVVNSDDGAEDIASAAEKFILTPAVAAPLIQSPEAAALLTTVFDQLETGSIDKKLLAPNLQFFFTPQVIADYKDSLASFGKVTAMELQGRGERGGMDYFLYKVTGTGKELRTFIYVTKDGLLDQIMLRKMEP